MKCRVCDLEFDPKDQVTAIDYVRRELQDMAINFTEETFERVNGLCPFCTQLSLHRNALELWVQYHLTNPAPPAFNEVFNQLLDLLIVDGGIKTHEEIRVLMSKELDDLMPKLGHQARMLAYRVVFKYVRMWKPPHHVEEAERNLMKRFHEKQGYSMSDLAFMFDRSKETIWRAMKEPEKQNQTNIHIHN